MVSTIPARNFESESEFITLVEGKIVNCKVIHWNWWSKCYVCCGRDYKMKSQSTDVSLFYIFHVMCKM